MAPVRLLSALPEGTSLSKLLICLVEGNGSAGAAAEIAAERCRELPQVERALRAIEKTAVTGGTLSSLNVGSDIGAEFHALIRSASIYGRLTPRFRRVPFRTKVARESGTGAAGAWTGEGIARPATTSTTDLVELGYTEANAMIVVTKEVLRHGMVAEAAVRDMLAGGVTAFVDQQLLDPSVSASASRPASLTNGCEAVSSSGSSASQILSDLDSLLAAVSTALTGGVWIMRRSTFCRIAAKLATVGLSVNEENLLGLPVICGSSSPQQVTLLDAATIVHASDDSVSVDAISAGAIEMVDSSSQSAVSGTGATLVSLFQTGSVAIKATFAANYEHTTANTGSPAQPAACAYMTVAY